MQRAPVLRPIDQLFADGWRLIRRQWPAYLAGIGLGFALIFCLLFSALAPYLFWMVHFIRTHVPRIPAHATLPQIWTALQGSVGIAVVGFVGLFFGIIFVGNLVQCWGEATLALASAHGTARRADACTVFLQAWRKAWPLFWTRIATSLVAFGGMVWCVVPGIVCAIALSMAWYIRVLEDVPLSQALAASWERSRGHRWGILGRYLLLLCVVFALAIALQILNLFPLAFLVLLPVSLLFQFSIPVMYGVAGYLIYLDLRPADTSAAPPVATPARISIWMPFFAGSAFLPILAVVFFLFWKVVVR
ncbi:MAG: hypothetical protein HY543_06305 [Deltaproteobacteria bacterium]|nr:hypothetical protein [Deltaproteobacteria bacterium]